MSSIEPSSLTRPITSIPNVTARFFCSRCSRSVLEPADDVVECLLAVAAEPEAGVDDHDLGVARGGEPGAAVERAGAIFAFFSSGWPGKAKSGAWTERTMSFSLATSPRRSAHG